MSRTIKDLQTSTAGVTVRAATPADGAAIAALAAVDSASAPAGTVIVAEVGRRLVAALAVEGGRAVADPFMRTAALVEMLDLRAAQLRRAAEHGTRRVPRMRRERTAARAAA